VACLKLTASLAEWYFAQPLRNSQKSLKKKKEGFPADTTRIFVF
jgi:hypothetical protein